MCAPTSVDAQVTPRSTKREVKRTLTLVITRRQFSDPSFKQTQLYCRFALTTVQTKFNKTRAAL